MQISFYDHIPGTCILQTKNGEAETRFVEMDFLKQIAPTVDFEKAIADARGSLVIGFSDK